MGQGFIISSEISLYTHIHFTVLHALRTVATRHNNNVALRQEFHTWPVVSAVIALFRRRSLRRTPGCQSRFGGPESAATSTRLTACRRHDNRWETKMPTGTGFLLATGRCFICDAVSILLLHLLSVRGRRHPTPHYPKTTTHREKMTDVPAAAKHTKRCQKLRHIATTVAFWLASRKKTSTTTPPATPSYWRH